MEKDNRFRSSAGRQGKPLASDRESVENRARLAAVQSAFRGAGTAVERANACLYTEKRFVGDVLQLYATALLDPAGAWTLSPADYEQELADETTALLMRSWLGKALCAISTLSVARSSLWSATPAALLAPSPPPRREQEVLALWARLRRAVPAWLGQNWMVAEQLGLLATASGVGRTPSAGVGDPSEGMPSSRGNASLQKSVHSGRESATKRNVSFVESAAREANLVARRPAVSSCDQPSQDLKSLQTMVFAEAPTAQRRASARVEPVSAAESPETASAGAAAECTFALWSSTVWLGISDYAYGDVVRAPIDRSNDPKKYVVVFDEDQYWQGLFYPALLEEWATASPLPQSGNALSQLETLNVANMWRWLARKWNPSSLAAPGAWLVLLALLSVAAENAPSEKLRVLRMVNELQGSQFDGQECSSAPHPQLRHDLREHLFMPFVAHITKNDPFSLDSGDRRGDRLSVYPHIGTVTADSINTMRRADRTKRFLFLTRKQQKSTLETAMRGPTNVEDVLFLFSDEEDPLQFNRSVLAAFSTA